MRVDVVGAVLGVILHDEDGGPRPELRAGDRFNDPSEGQVIVRDGSGWRRVVGRGAAGVVVGQADDLEPGHMADLFETGQVVDESSGTPWVRIIQVKAA